MAPFTHSLTNYRRRSSSPVKAGSVTIGGGHPIVVQSMTNTPTTDTRACVEQIRRIREAGCRMVRLTVPAQRDMDNLPAIVESLKNSGASDVVTVADIHFTPGIADQAAGVVDKVRINPGNYNDPDGSRLAGLVDKCRARGVALRIGVNHGSLAPHIVERFGDTPQGMVESAMEFLRKCLLLDFDQVVVSMKSSNVRVMVHAYRLLAEAMESENMDFPLHLGVTEAGDGIDGRIKSAVGIGTLLADGIGDTIRVSLTEPPENEIPVANEIADYFSGREAARATEPIKDTSHYNPYSYTRRKTDGVASIGGKNHPIIYSELGKEALDAIDAGKVKVIDGNHVNTPAQWRAVILNMSAQGDTRPVILRKRYSEPEAWKLAVKAACDFGPLFIDGLADGIWIENGNDTISPAETDDIALSILQAARVRMSKTDYIACPGCGRTLFDLQGTLAKVRELTSHLKGLKIGVMGCIVNGPGEMADADYGYVGSGRERITLYKGREVVCRDIPESQAPAKLVELIKLNNDWHEP